MRESAAMATTTITATTSVVGSGRKSTLARSCERAMQRRGINKRLSFAEAENGQKDRNEEEVEEEREPATEKGINKSGSAQGKKG